MAKIRSEILYSDVFAGKEPEALRAALAIREFEIGLYWERAKYFAALIGATLTGYGVVQSADDVNHRDVLAVLLAGIGLTLSVAWYLVNIGSKHWQDNWERHVDLLEDAVMGPLYKTVLGGNRYSVSKVNQIVSEYAVVVWLGLLMFSLPWRFDGLLPSWLASDFGAMRAAWVGTVVFVARLIWVTRRDSNGDIGEMVFEMRRDGLTTVVRSGKNRPVH